MIADFACESYLTGVEEFSASLGDCIRVGRDVPAFQYRHRTFKCLIVQCKHWQCGAAGCQRNATLRTCQPVECLSKKEEQTGDQS